jgi:hypothetical protein
VAGQTFLQLEDLDFPDCGVEFGVKSKDSRVLNIVATVVAPISNR